MIKHVNGIKKIGFLLCLIFISACYPSLELVNSNTDNLNIDQNVLFLSGTDRPTEIFIASIEKNSQTQLTKSDGRIYDYSVQSNPFRIAYSTLNPNNGTDYWLISDLKSPAEQLFTCDFELCFSAEFSPDGEFMLVTRSNTNSNSSKSTIWKYHFSDEVFEPLIPGTDVFGDHAVISRDHGYVAYRSFTPTGIQILNANGEEERFVGMTQATAGFTWAEVGDVLYYITEEIIGELPTTNLWALNMKTEDIFQILPESTPDSSITKIKPSPDNSKLMIGMVENPLIPNQMILILDLDSGEIINQLKTPSVSFGNFSWSQNGEKIVFQKFEFTGSDSKPEVGIWDLTSNNISSVAKNAYYPVFSP